MDQLSVEMIMQILSSTIGSHSHAVDARRLAELATVSSTFADAARRLLYRRVVLESPDAGVKLLRSLKDSVKPSAKVALGPMIKSLTINDAAYSQPTVFSDITADDILRYTTQLVHYEPAMGNFAPLGDGRVPAAAYPDTIRHFRLAHTILEIQNSDPEEDEEVGSDDGSDGDQLPAPLNRLNDLSAGVRSFKMERLVSPSLGRAEAPTVSFPFQWLKKLEVIFVNLSPSTLDWMTKGSIAAGTLADLKLWMVGGISSADTKALLMQCGSTLKTFEYKAVVSDTGRALNEVLPHLPVLERLSLGAGAANHRIYPALPASLKHLVVCLPNNHQAADLEGIVKALGPTGQLQSLQSLSLYSQIYFAPTIEVDYSEDYDPISGRAPTPSLRSLRLSHVNASNWTPLFSLVGPQLRALSLHHVNTATRALINYCPKLRRLELGVAIVGIASLPTSPTLHLLRAHLTSELSLDSVIRAVKDKRYPMLKEIDLTGDVPDNVPQSWLSGAKMDELVAACKEESVEMSLNGMRISSMGDLWGAIMHHARR